MSHREVAVSVHGPQLEVQRSRKRSDANSLSEVVWLRGSLSLWTSGLRVRVRALWLLLQLEQADCDRQMAEKEAKQRDVDEWSAMQLPSGGLSSGGVWQDDGGVLDGWGLYPSLMRVPQSSLSAYKLSTA